jgi:ornithine--oxo-acid transaminase
LQVLVEEKLAERAQHLGELFRQQLRDIKSERVKTVRGRGMLNALVIQVSCSKQRGPQLCCNHLRTGLMWPCA